MIYKIFALTEKPDVWAQRVTNVEKVDYDTFSYEINGAAFRCRRYELVENPQVILDGKSISKIVNPYYKDWSESLLNAVYPISDYAEFFPVYKEGENG